MKLRRHPEVVAELARLKASGAKESQRTRAAWMTDLDSVAHFRPSRFIRDDGSVDIAEAKRCGALDRITGFKVHEFTDQDGVEHRKIDLRFPDQLSALVQIGRAEDYYGGVERHKVEVAFDTKKAIEDLTPEEEEQLKGEMTRLGIIPGSPADPDGTGTEADGQREADRGIAPTAKIRTPRPVKARL
jgi:hypothetical protein